MRVLFDARNVFRIRFESDTLALGTNQPCGTQAEEPVRQPPKSGSDHQQLSQTAVELARSPIKRNFFENGRAGHLFFCRCPKASSPIQRHGFSKHCGQFLDGVLPGNFHAAQALGTVRRLGKRCENGFL